MAQDGGLTSGSGSVKIPGAQRFNSSARTPGQHLPVGRQRIVEVVEVVGSGCRRQRPRDVLKVLWLSAVDVTRQAEG